MWGEYSPSWIFKGNVEGVPRVAGGSPIGFIIGGLSFSIALRHVFFGGGLPSQQGMPRVFMFRLWAVQQHMCTFRCLLVREADELGGNTIN
jgi:hypothetical protein